ncbi:hypothetical protein WMF30_42620 [Sorangium sp. So ce134]
MWRIEGTANVDRGLLAGSNRDYHARITYADPPNVVIHLFKMNPIIDDEFVEDALTFNLYSLCSAMSEHSPIASDHRRSL